MLEVSSSNTIIYTDAWAATVAFYRDALRLESSFSNDWFVEFHLTTTSTVSIADASRATIRPSNGAGLTLSWCVYDVAETRTRLVERGVQVGPLGRRFGAPICDLVDPTGTRIELWSPADGDGHRPLHG